MRAADGDQPVSNVRTLADIVESSVASRAIEVRVLGAFAAIAFLLAAVGIHGVLAFAVRAARGRSAYAWRWVRAVATSSHGGAARRAPRAGGVIPGLAAAWYAGKTMEALLAGIKPYDTAVFVVAAGLCVAMALLGCLLPAWRAARVDPMTAMRAD